MGKASNVGRSRVLAGDRSQTACRLCEPFGAVASVAAPERWEDDHRHRGSQRKQTGIPEWRILCALLHGERLFGLGYESRSCCNVSDADNLDGKLARCEGGACWSSPIATQAAPRRRAYVNSVFCLDKNEQMENNKGVGMESPMLVYLAPILLALASLITSLSALVWSIRRRV